MALLSYTQFMPQLYESPEAGFPSLLSLETHQYFMASCGSEGIILG